MTTALVAPDSDEYARIRERIRGKSAALVEVGLEELFPILIDKETAPGTKLAIMRDLSELGDLKPKRDAQVASAGPGFSVTINIPSMGEGKFPELRSCSSPITIQGEVIEPDEELPPKPPYLTFELDNNDLRGKDAERP